MTVFDPGRVGDRATYREPGIPSEGIVHVLVKRVPKGGRRVAGGVTPGRLVLCEPRAGEER